MTINRYTPRLLVGEEGVLQMLFAEWLHRASADVAKFLRGKSKDSTKGNDTLRAEVKRTVFRGYFHV